MLSTARCLAPFHSFLSPIGILVGFGVSDPNFDFGIMSLSSLPIPWSHQTARVFHTWTRAPTPFPHPFLLSTRQ